MNLWYPVVAAETIQFRRSLRPFERFDIAAGLCAEPAPSGVPETAARSYAEHATWPPGAAQRGA